MRGGTVKLNDTQPVVAGGEGPTADRQVGTSTVPIDAFGDETAPGGPLSENILRSGQVVDRYRIVRLIASGGMARVYEATHAFTKKQVALKVMHHRLADRPDMVERFRHEAMALSSIRHENVVNVENAGLTDDGHVFIAMDLLNGKNLREVLESGNRLGLKEALRLVGEVAQGVAAAHDIRVIHRDLKPENIFCMTGGPAKVLDLGTAKFAGNNAPTTQTAFGKVIGTAAYIAPERLEGEPGDERCDIYALGLVLYECIAGFHPLAPTGKWPSAAEIASRQVTYNPRPIPGLPHDIWNIIARAIQKRPERRYQSMREFQAAVGAVAVQTVPVKRRPERKENGSSWSGLSLPIVAGFLVGSSAAGIAFRQRFLHANQAASAPSVTSSVPSIQKEASASQGTFEGSPIVAPAIASIAPSPPPSNEAVSVKANQPVTRVASTSSIAVSARATSKATVGVPESSAAVGTVESKPPVANKTNPGSANNPSVGTPRTSKEDLPASGL
jgi:serine/threonine protein kinase